MRNLKMLKNGGIVLLALSATSNIMAAENIEKTIFVPKINIDTTKISCEIYVDGNIKQSEADISKDKKQVYKTIQDAVDVAIENNKKNIGTKITIKPGIYRESVKIANTKTDAPIILKAETHGKVIISGSDIWSTWKKAGKSGRLYTAKWTYNWGLTPYPHLWEQFVQLKPIARRRELVYIKDHRLEQVFSPLNLKPGKFFISEDNDKIFIYSKDEIRDDKLIAEIGVRNKLLSITKAKNIMISGITFLNSTDVLQKAAFTIYESSNIIVRNCSFFHNSWTGIAVSCSSDVELKNLISNYNGGMGISMYKDKNILVEDCETSYNNWRGYAGGMTGHAAGGFKLGRVHNAVFRRHKSTHNLTGGFWPDYDCRDMLIEDALWSHNLTYGTFLEACQGPIVIKNSIICFNGKGIQTTNSSNILLKNNIIIGNKSSQILVTGIPYRKINDWETKQVFEKLKVEDWTVVHNIIVTTDNKQKLISIPGWNHFLNTFSCNANLYFDYSSSKQPRFLYSGMTFSLKDWQRILNKDQVSIFGNPKIKDISNPDFLLDSGSPYFSLLKKEVDTKIAKATPDSRKLLAKKKLEMIKQNWAKEYPLIAKCKKPSWQQVDISKAVNRAMSGEDSWNGCNSFDFLPLGIVKIHGIPFMILNQSQNNGKAIIALKSNKLKMSNGKELESKITVPVGCKAKAVFILHGCSWGQEHKKNAEYKFVYTDGSSATVDIIPYGLGSEHIKLIETYTKESNLQDWFVGYTQFENANAKKVPVTKKSNPLDFERYLYSLKWENPYPKKEIEKIVLSSQTDKSATVFIFAISILL